MNRTEFIIRGIGISLTILFGLTFFEYLVLLLLSEFYPFHLALLSSLLILFVSSVGLFRMQEWARRLMIVFSAFMASLQIGMFYIYPRLVEPLYIFVNLGTVLLLVQVQVKAQFHSLSDFGRKSVLVVDDDEGFLRTVSRVLLPQGYSVLTATTGERGIQIAKLQRPDLIILDVILPGMKGREVCAVLKENEVTGHIPVIFVTAKDSPDDVAAEMAVGGDSHLSKPVDSKTLLSAVRECLKP